MSCRVLEDLLNKPSARNGIPITCQGHLPVMEVYMAVD